MTKMMIDHKLVYDWYMASPGDHLCSVYAWYTGNFPFGIRLVYGAVLFGIRVDFFTYSLVNGLSLWFGIRAVYAGISVPVLPVYGKYTLVYGDPLLHVGLT